MIKKAITFEDFDGKTVTEEHYFHLYKSELLEFELGQSGGTLSEIMPKLLASGDNKRIMELFREIISRSYGQRVDGSGKSFYKSEKIRDEFLNSLAFDALYTELMTDAHAMAVFFNGVMPSNLAPDPETVRKAFMEAGLPDPGPSPEAVAKAVEPVPAGFVRGADGRNWALDPDGTRPIESEPWADREPTHQELQSMDKNQLLKAMHRKSKQITLRGEDR